MGTDDHMQEKVSVAPRDGIRRRLVWSAAFGVVFLSAILMIAIVIPEPSEFQIFVFRVVIAVAAGGIGAILPGFIKVKAVEHVQAGGALGFAVLFFLVNPPGLVTDFTPFSDAIRQADEAVAIKNYSAASEFFKKAHQARPKNSIPFRGLGRVEYLRGNYSLSLENFERAFEFEHQKDGATAYAIAMAQDALGDYKTAKRYLGLASNLLPNGSEIGSDVMYDRGLMSLMLWLNHGASRDTEDYRDAEAAFGNFLERRGFPSHWAMYHVACLRATRAQDPELADEKVAVLRAEAMEQLHASIRELGRYMSDKAPFQRESMRRLLTAPESWVRRPGEPVACPALIQMGSSSRESISTLVSSLL